jgi:hypothetical protein
LANWDGQWYKSIAIDGYPMNLPVEAGRVLQNEWAFYPFFPTMSRAVMSMTGVSFEVAAGLLNLVCGAVAVVLLHGLLRERMSTFAAAATIACFCGFPTAVVLQVAYSESTTMLLLVLTIVALQSRRYGLFSGLVVVLSLARPIALPLLFVTALHWAIRWRKEGRPSGRREWSTPLATLSVTAASSALWPSIAWLSSGERRAFFLTQEAWRWSEHSSFVSASVLGQAIESSGRMLAVVLALLAFFVALSATRPGSRWGLELRAWVAVYPLYIMIATQPTFSVARYLMLALVPWWPFAGGGARADRGPATRLLAWFALALIITLGLMAQYLWVTRVFTVDVGPEHQTIP